MGVASAGGPAERRTLRRWVVALALGGAGCADGAAGVVSVGECSTLIVTPSSASVPTSGAVQLQVEGGSGDWRAVWVDNASGGALSESGGTYVAGAAGGVTDLVQIVDERCGSSAVIPIVVTSTLEVTPRRAEVVPGTRMTLQVRGGSGRVRCELFASGSRAVVEEDCRYTAGALTGTDTVRVTDLATGASLDAWIDVDPAAVFGVAGAGGIFIPEGARHRPAPRHGSGVIALEVASGAVVVEGDEVVGAPDSAGVVRVSDVFTGDAVEVPVATLAPRVTVAPRDGERTGGGVVLGIGDQNGDGYDDVVFGSPELSVSAHQGGAVAVYAGGPDGLASTPAWVLAGDDVYETLGGAVGIADLDGDGLRDLWVGDSRLDRVASNVGALRVYAGVPGGFFASSPSRTWYGIEPFDRLGTAVATCDFDADGHLDLAVGAADATDRNVAVPAEDQGGVYVYRGSSDGLAERPDFVLFGRLPGAAGFEGVAGLGVGEALVAADLDGDGLCDLASGGPTASPWGDDEDGVVLIWRGTTDAGLVLEREPTWTVWGDAGRDGGWGRALAAADVDGDGAAELAVSAWTDGGGLVSVFAGAGWASRPAGAALSPGDAEVEVRGGDVAGQLGAGVALRDLDGDGEVDLVVGASQEDDPSADQGVVYGWTDLRAALGDAPAELTPARASFRARGARAGDELGQALDVVGDVDGDGEAEVVALAGLASDFGVEVGAPFVIQASGALGGPLEPPGVAAGHEVGRGLALLPLGGALDASLVVGAPGAAEVAVGANAGIVEVWGPGASAAQRPFGAIDHLGPGDRFGAALAVGDGDGDGRLDLAVAARSDSRPSAFVGSFVNPTACPGLRSSAGAVRVFRGGAAGLSPVPSTLWFGPVASGYVPTLVGGLDHDGDGREDWLAASTTWGAGGGYAFLWGRAADASRTTVVCDGGAVLGEGSFDRLGSAATALGDLDGDGCDEAAVGATGEERRSDFANQGVVRVLWGYGPACDRRSPEVTALALDAPGVGLGSSLAGGVDVDGDGVPDLVVGGSTHRVYFAEMGGAWVVPGAYLASLPKSPLVSGALPDPEDGDVSLLLPDRGLDARRGVIGDVAGGLFGASVASWRDGDAAYVAVGAPAAGAGGSRTGAVYVYRWTDAGLDEAPWWVVAGEASEGELGATLLAGTFEGGRALVVGAPRSDQGGVDLGAVYVVPLGP